MLNFLLVILWLILIVVFVWLAPDRYGDGIKRNWEPPFPLPKRKDDDV